MPSKMCETAWSAFKWNYYVSYVTLKMHFNLKRTLIFISFSYASNLKKQMLSVTLPHPVFLQEKNIIIFVEYYEYFLDSPEYLFYYRYKYFHSKGTPLCNSNCMCRPVNVLKKKKPLLNLITAIFSLSKFSWNFTTANSLYASEYNCNCIKFCLRGWI